VFYEVSDLVIRVGSPSDAWKRRWFEPVNLKVSIGLVCKDPLG